MTNVRKTGLELAKKIVNGELSRTEVLAHSVGELKEAHERLSKWGCFLDKVRDKLLEIHKELDNVKTIVEVKALMVGYKETVKFGVLPKDKALSDEIASKLKQKINSADMFGSIK